MARKTAIITITADGRDKGKVFHIQEMPALNAERWATKALLALARSGAGIPDDIASAGLAGVASLGMKAFAGLNYDDAEPLLAEMLECVSIIPDPNNRTMMRSDIFGDIEEVSTLLKLRMEVYSLHTGFSRPAVNSNSTTMTGPAGQQHSHNTSTSRHR